MVKILFVDIDGVLVRQISATKKLRPAIPDSGCLNNLNKVLSESGAKLVVSSDWGKRCTITQLQEMFVKWGITSKVLGKTSLGGRHDAEIFAWLLEKDLMGVVFASVDDQNFRYPMNRYNVKTRPELGLTDEDAKRALELLK